MKIGLLTGGGDCPGLNAVIRAVTRCLIRQCGAEVLGIQDGFAGLREEWEALHAWRGRSVALTAGNNATLGIVLGVDERGAIRLSVDGVDRSFSGGELSLRLQHDS